MNRDKIIYEYGCYPAGKQGHRVRHPELSWQAKLALREPSRGKAIGKARSATTYVDVLWHNSLANNTVGLQNPIVTVR